MGSVRPGTAARIRETCESRYAELPLAAAEHAQGVPRRGSPRNGASSNPGCGDVRRAPASLICHITPPSRPLDELAPDVSLDASVRPARCAIAVRLPEDLSEKQRRRLEHVAKACAVVRTLERGIEFEHSTVLAATGTV